MRGLLILLVFVFSSGAFAEKEIKQTYKGTALGKDGKVAYVETHQAVRDPKGRILRSSTEYARPNGEVFGRLTSDFTTQITAPTYTFTDSRDGSSHGIDLRDGSYILWKKTKDGKREEAKVKPGDFSKDTLIVGCQGLHYYLVDNLDKLDRKKTIPIKYLIPGKLDYYSFALKVEKEDEEFIHLKVRVENVILRAFVSALELTYRKKDGHLVEYKGLSNISKDDGSMQSVDIDYDMKSLSEGKIL